jgi:uncharacterized protein YydD (DUF2326 family)
MSTFEILKSAANTLKEANKIEQYQQILEAQAKLLEMQKRINELENENKELKEKLSLKKDLIVENNSYYIKRRDQKDGPFCMKCHDVAGKLVRLYKSEDGYFRCYNCRTSPVNRPPRFG